MKSKWFVMIITGILATGCTTVHRGVVAMKISDTVAHVCLNKGEVSVGDTVKMYSNVCKQNLDDTSGAGENSYCEKRLMGNGTVTKILNEHYSVVTLLNGTDFKEGDFVEKSK